MSDFTTITAEAKAEILQLLEDIKGACNQNLYAKTKAEKITKILNNYDTTGKTK